MSKTHCLSRTPVYEVWKAMKQRCHNPKNKDYRHYGGRGIVVCQRWRESFPAFLADMGPRPTGYTLERRENSKGYEPGNCYWATWKEQVKNKRIHDRCGEKGSNAKANVVLVERIRELHKQGLSCPAIAAQVGTIKRSQVYNIISGVSWK